MSTVQPVSNGVHQFHVVIGKHLDYNVNLVPAKSVGDLHSKRNTVLPARVGQSFSSLH
jgi:hypothetical protein